MEVRNPTSTCVTNSDAERPNDASSATAPAVPASLSCDISIGDADRQAFEILKEAIDDADTCGLLSGALIDRLLSDRLPEAKQRLYWKWFDQASESKRLKAGDPDVTISTIRTTDFRIVASHAALKRHICDALAGGLPPLHIGQHRGSLFSLYLSRGPDNLTYEPRYLSSFAPGTNKFAPELYLWVRPRRCEDMIQDAQLHQVLERDYGYCSSLPIVRGNTDVGEIAQHIAYPTHSSSAFAHSGDVAAKGVPNEGAELPGQLDAAEHALRCLNQPFFHLGRVYQQRDDGTPVHKMRGRWSLTHHFVAVSMADNSVWLFYDAWDPPSDYDDYPPDELDSVDTQEEPPTCARFRPSWDRNWACLGSSSDSGHGGGPLVIAKIADRISDWGALGREDAQLAPGKCVFPRGQFPVLVCCRRGADGSILPPWATGPVA